MMEFLAQMMRLPVMAVVYSMEMLVKTMQGLQRMADQGIDAVVGRSTQASNDALDNRDNLTNDAKVSGMTQTSTNARSESNLITAKRASVAPDTSGDSTETVHKEENMTDN